MGKRNWRGGGRGGRGGKRGRSGDKNAPYQKNYPDLVKENAAFEAYYKAQNIVPEEEWSQFMDSLKAPLPSSFRITPTGPFADEIRDEIKTKFSTELKGLLDDEGNPVNPPKCLSWYPNELAWSISVSRKHLRKSEQFASFQKFLIRQNSTGNITRQEAVSMIPPLLLNVEPGLRVLDTCAAPGSKTSQIIEFLESDRVDANESLCVANDADNARCHMLVHQLKRLANPCVMVVNTCGQFLPRFKVEAEAGGATESMYFDRVLCDVPCSGDGTFRKSIDMWRKWIPNNGLALHRLQYQIFMRGLDQLKIGGRIVYSTCSFNPLENEAVVASVLSEYGDALEILDVTNELPGLKRMPGLSNWKVPNTEGELFAALNDIPDDYPNKYRIHKSMFPPEDDKVKALLSRCVRVLPHHQDTGGFFIAAFVKKGHHASHKHDGSDDAASGAVDSAAPADATATAAGADDTAKAADGAADGATDGAADKDDAADGPAGDKAGADDEGELKRRGRGTARQDRRGKQKYNPDEQLRPLGDTGIGEQIVEFFGLPDTFPIHQVLSSSPTHKRLLFVSKTILRFLKPQFGREYLTPRMITSGVKMFDHNDAKTGECPYRIRQEAAPLLLPHMKKRVHPLNCADFVQLLKNHNLTFEQMTDKETRASMETIASGCVIFTLRPDAASADRRVGTVHATAWRSRQSCHLFVSKEDVAVLLGQLAPEPEPETTAKESPKDGAAAPMEESATPAPEKTGFSTQ